MLATIEEFCERHGIELVTRCEKNYCRLDLSDLPNAKRRRIIDGDEYAKKRAHVGQICDFFLFVRLRANVAAVVELKSGSVDVSEAVAQLQAGAEEVTKILNAVAGLINRVQFLALVVGPIRSAIEQKAIAQQKVLFHGRGVRVLKIACGRRFSTVLGNNFL